MELTTEKTEYIAGVATEVVTRLADIAKSAARELTGPRTVSTNALAYPNATNAMAAVDSLSKSVRAVREGNEHLTREPAIARVVAFVSQDCERTYYICRTTPALGVQNLASYRSPVGRLASLDIGESIVIPNGEQLEVVERATLVPIKVQGDWDSMRTVIDTDNFGGPITVRSLRDFLRSFCDIQNVDDILEQIQAEDKLSESLVAGLQRSVITKMGLRDQPILNSIQDAIFRLPIDRQLILLGPPGTGKTTTLIRRVGQKLDEAYLTEDERELITAINAENRLPHEESWMMFTPTKLLRLYLKEAFAREQVPASDARIQTWDDFRWNVSKNVFNILRGSTGAGLFVLRPEVSYLRDDTQVNAIGWFEDFFEWQRDEFQREMGEAANALGSSSMDGARSLAKKLQDALSGGGWNALTAEASKAQSLVASIKGSSDNKINGALKEQLKKNAKFIDELAQFLDTLGQEPEANPDDTDDGDGPDDDEDIDVAHTPRSKAINRYKQTLRSHARAMSAKRSVSKESSIAKVIAWIGDRTLPDAELVTIGKALLTQSNANRFTKPIHRYITGFHRRYRKFRKLRQSQGHWYEQHSIEARDIHPLELDIILLAILRASMQFLSRPQIVRQLDQPLWGSLKPVSELYRNQILVDEATDFSPIQLACMAALSHPTTRSFFACGDFNQRLTTWGTQSAEEMKWISPGLEFEEVNIAYRQTRQLNTLARDIIAAVGGSNPIVELPKEVDNEGVAPALIEGISDLDLLTRWLADRLQEIERFVGQMPSTAIFVNSEDSVVPLAEQLDRELIEHNLRVVACSKGQIVGQDSDIRVFDIQHIKGLEFEAVFFVGVDGLAEQHPSLFDKFLYVGATRAATYLGLTCDQQLPSVIESLRPQFTSDWSAPEKATGGAT